MPEQATSRGATTLAELALEQGVRPIQRLEEILGKGEGLWTNAEEFVTFLHDIYRRRL